MKGFRPSDHRDAEVSLEIQARRSGSKIHDRKPSHRPFNRKSCTKAKLSDDQIRWVRANWDGNGIGGDMGIVAMSRELNVNKATISQICHGQSWKEVK